MAFPVGDWERDQTPAFLPMQRVDDTSQWYSLALVGS
ncbi:hypothetical protein NIES19_52030 [Anabaena cylindrica PCC 7122]|nr:hypothetical protein NIES19_52030 [Anabaena cylindrica PCC 7122]